MSANRPNPTIQPTQSANVGNATNESSQAPLIPPTPTSPDRDVQIKSLQWQSEFAYKAFNDRRQYEWKISFGLWGLLIAAISYLPTHLPIKAWWVSIICIFIPIIIHGSWLNFLYDSNKKDTDIAFRFRSLAYQVTVESNPKFNKEELDKLVSEKEFTLTKKKFFVVWSMILQLIVTIILSILLGIFIAFKPQ